jgi:hypothetical protein
MPSRMSAFSSSSSLSRSAAVGGHLLDHARGVLLAHALDEIDLGLGVHLLERVGRDLGVRQAEERLALVDIEVLEDLGQLRRCSWASGWWLPRGAGPGAAGAAEVPEGCTNFQAIRWSRS